MQLRLRQFPRACLSLRSSPATSRRGARRKSIRWWPCDTSELIGDCRLPIADLEGPALSSYLAGIENGNWTGSRKIGNRKLTIGNVIMETLLKELRYGIRSLLKHPGFTAIAVITLALGIGANTAIFSVINAVLLRPLPYHEPERLVTIWEESPQRDMYEMPVSFANLRDWVDQNHSFEQISAYTFTNLNLTGAAEPARLGAVRASANLFSLVGAAPQLGRAFLPEEDKEGANRAVILGHA